MLKGIDVSSYQGTINWDSVKASGIQFAIVRAGWGKEGIDPFFVRNMSHCNLRGIPVGVYWFSYALNPSDAIAEAKVCTDLISRFTVEYPVCFDFEYKSADNMNASGIKPTKALVSEIADAFLSTVEKSGYFAMNYTNLDYYTHYYTKEINQRYGRWFAGVSNLEKPGVKSYIYQMRDTEYVDGIKDKVDIDYTEIDFPKWMREMGCNHLTANEPPKQSEEEIAMKWAVSEGIIPEGKTGTATWEDMAITLKRYHDKFKQ